MIRAPSPWFLLGSLLVGLIFSIVVLPAGVGPARPFLLAMLLAYWLMEAPNNVGLGIAFAVGLLADLATATPLGEQALRLVVLAFLVQRFRARLRFFPLWQQALAIGLILLNDRIIATLLHLIMGDGLPPWSSWLSPLLAMVIWPWLFVLLDLARLRARERS
jgi:rod shape-determining protein MreD